MEEEMIRRLAAENRTLRRVSFVLIVIAGAWMLVTMKTMSRVGELTVESMKLRDICELRVQP